jgi:hypothetical protein
LTNFCAQTRVRLISARGISLLTIAPPEPMKAFPGARLKVGLDGMISDSL